VLAVVAARFAWAIWPSLALMAALTVTDYLLSGGLSDLAAALTVAEPGTVATAGKGLEVVAGQVTAPGAAFTAWTMNAGNTLSVRNADLSKKIMLLDAWAKNQAAGSLRIRSPKLHDNVQGLRFDVTATDVDSLMGVGYKQPLFAQDTLIVEQTGSAVAGDIEMGGFLIFYEDLPGQDARFIGYDDLVKKGMNEVTVENTLATGVAGGYSGEEAINAEFDLLKANTDYALMGYLVDAICGTVRWRGPDFGNLGLGGPGNQADRWFTREWFSRMARIFQMPLIPVFNSANKAGTLLDAHQDENGVDVTVTSILVELGPNPTAR
jgi:hypothetical protein